MITYNHWIFKVSEKEFRNSLDKELWGCYSQTLCAKRFLESSKKNDILWFIKESNIILGCATLESTYKRQLGPLVNIGLTDSELGWNSFKKKDFEIRYTNFIDLKNKNIRYDNYFYQAIIKHSKKVSKINLKKKFRKFSNKS